MGKFLGTIIGGAIVAIGVALLLVVIGAASWAKVIAEEAGGLNSLKNHGPWYWHTMSSFLVANSV